MTVYVPRQSLEVDPLIAEAKRRMRRRRFLAGVALLAAAAAAGAVYGLRSHPGATGTPSATPPSLRQYDGGDWSIRYLRGMHVEHSHGAITNNFPFVETTLANFVPRKGYELRKYPGYGGGYGPYAAPPQGSATFPAHGVALRVVYDGWGDGNTQTPLRLSSFRVAPRTEYEGLRPLQHEFATSGARYLVEVWIGRDLSARQRAVLARMVASLSLSAGRAQLFRSLSR